MVTVPTITIGSHAGACNNSGRGVTPSPQEVIPQTLPASATTATSASAPLHHPPIPRLMQRCVPQPRRPRISIRPQPAGLSRCLPPLQTYTPRVRSVNARGEERRLARTHALDASGTLRTAGTAGDSTRLTAWETEQRYLVLSFGGKRGEGSFPFLPSVRSWKITEFYLRLPGYEPDHFLAEPQSRLNLKS